MLTFMLRAVHLVSCATMYCAADLEMFEFKYLDIFFCLLFSLVCGVCFNTKKINKPRSMHNKIPAKIPIKVFSYFYCHHYINMNT